MKFKWPTKEEKWEIVVAIVCINIPFIGWLYLLAREDIKRTLQNKSQG